MDTDVGEIRRYSRTYNAKLRQMQMIDYDDQMIYAPSEFWNSILRYLHFRGAVSVFLWMKRRILRKYSMI